MSAYRDSDSGSDSEREDIVIDDDLPQCKDRRETGHTGFSIDEILRPAGQRLEAGSVPLPTGPGFERDSDCHSPLSDSHSQDNQGNRETDSTSAGAGFARGASPGVSPGRRSGSSRASCSPPPGPPPPLYPSLSTPAPLPPSMCLNPFTPVPSLPPFDPIAAATNPWSYTQNLINRHIFGLNGKSIILSSF